MPNSNMEHRQKSIVKWTKGFHKIRVPYREMDQEIPQDYREMNPNGSGEIADIVKWTEITDQVPSWIEPRNNVKWTKGYREMNQKKLPK